MANLNFDVIYRDHGAERGLKNLGDRSERTRRAMNGLKVAGVAALAAVGVAGVAAARFGVASVKAYAEAEQSQLRLSEAYRKFPKLADTSIGSLRDLNSELAKKTRFDDDATASGQAVLAQFSLTGKQITQLTPLLQDYAAKTGKDLPTAAKDLGKAVMGQGRGLKAVGINFKDTGNQGKNLEQITKGLRTQVGGFAEKEGKTAAGQAEILKNQWGEVQEAVGSKLLPMLVKLAGWVSTHQADLIGMFVHTASGGIEFGIALARVVSGGLRGFGALSDGIGSFTAAQVDNLARFLHAATIAFSWIPGIGPRLVAADVKFSLFAANAHTNIHKTGDAVRGMADRIDAGLIPTLLRAGHNVDEFGRKEISSARQRDAANRARIAIERIGTAADGSQIHLKTWNDRTKLGAVAQKGLEDRIRAARTRMLEQRDAGIKANVSQHALNKRWEEGKDALYREFRQMGLSKKAAEVLADRYGKIPGKVETRHTTPGATAARRAAKELKERIQELRNKGVHISFSSNAAEVAKAYNISLVNRGRSAAGRGLSRSAQGGLIRGPGTGTSDSILGIDRHTGAPTSWVSNNEFVVNARQTSKNLRALQAINGGLDIHGFASGGTVSRRVVVQHGAMGVSGVPAGFDQLAERVAVNLGVRIAGALGQALRDASAGGGQGITGPVGGMTSFHGGRFTQLAAANLRRAEQIAGMPMHIMQGGWRPATSYSGTSHAGDAVDTQASARLIRAIRAVGWASGDRTGLGNWASHAHSVPSPSTGRARGSAVWQYQDYRRRGGASQGLGSPWGLASGGLLTARVAEEGPERLLDARTTRTFDRMVRVMDARGVTGTTIINISAPNYVGSREELRQTLVDMNRRGQLEVIKTR